MAWVCLCNAIDDSTVRNAILGGADDIESVGSACGAGTNCHGCHASIDDLIDQHGCTLSMPRRCAS